MQIPPLKKSTFYFIIAAVLLVGIVLGSLLLAGYLYIHKDKLFVLNQPVIVNTDLPQQFIEKVTALTPGMTISGRVLTKEASQFSIETTVSNPLDAKNSTTTEVTVPFDVQKDEVMLFKPVPGGSGEVEPLAGSFSDIKISTQLYVTVLQDKKIIYLVPTQ